MKNILLLAALAALVSGCGAEWADCPTCKDGEDSAEADDGVNIPVVVVVNVDVDVNVNNPPCTLCSVPDAGRPPSTPDAGTPPKPDAGTPRDAGCPPKKDCRRVCMKYEERNHCDRGWHGSDHKGRCNPKPHKSKKCVKEEVKCS